MKNANNIDFKIMIRQMFKSELLELLEHPNFINRKQSIKNQIKKRTQRIAINQLNK